MFRSSRSLPEYTPMEQAPGGNSEVEARNKAIIAAQVADIRAMSEFTRGALVILQMGFVAGHIDGMIPHWSLGYTTPAMILVIIEIVRFFLNMMSMDISKQKQEENEGKLAEGDTANMTFVEKLKTYVGADLRRSSGVMPAGLSNFFAFFRISFLITAAVLFIVHSAGLFSIEQGFSFSLVLVLALFGYIAELLAIIVKVLVDVTCRKSMGPDS